jgi:hypothetical protein
MSENVEDSATHDAKWHGPKGNVDSHATLAAALFQASVSDPDSQNDSGQNEKCIDVNHEWAKRE